jgi:dynein assembly factor 2
LFVPRLTVLFWTWQMERQRGFNCVFLHPQPGYVVKTANLRTDEKVFINVCSEANVGRPTSTVDVDAALGSGVRWSIPYVQCQPRKDVDKQGRPCSVYDVMVHPDSLALKDQGSRLKDMLTDTAVEAVETNFDVKLGRRLRYPKMKVKGHFKRTVIRRPLDQDETTKDRCSDHQDLRLVETYDPCGSKDLDVASPRVPQHSVKYRQNLSEDLPLARDWSGGALVSDPCRPSHVVVEVDLPEMASAKDLDLDVAETRFSLHSSHYSLDLRFAYPVMEEEATAKFDVGTRKLLVTVPVKAKDPAKRLTSTDSGIDVDTGYVEEDQGDSASKSSTEPQGEFPCSARVQGSDEDSLFPPYSCNIYEDVMVFTLDVKNVDQASLFKSPMKGEDFGFSLCFTSVGKGMVPFKYAFHCALVTPTDKPNALVNVGDASERVEVEVWDNNVIVKLSLPREAVAGRCEQYKVGSDPQDLTIHNLPQLRALRKKKEKLMVSISLILSLSGLGRVLRGCSSTLENFTIGS